jgi:hypothetical protein
MMATYAFGIKGIYQPLKLSIKEKAEYGELKNRGIFF